MRLRIVLLILAVLAATGAVAGIAFRGELAALPWDTARPFHYPTDCRAMADGGWLVVDQSGRRIIRIGAKGEMLWQLEGGQRGAGFYVAELKGIQPDGSAWLLNRVRSTSSGVDELVELRRLRADGALEPATWRLDTSHLEQTAYNQLPYFPHMHGGKLYCLIGDPQGNTLFHEITAETGRDRVVRRFDGLDAYQYVSAAYDPVSQRGWFLDIDSRLIPWDFAGGEPTLPADSQGAAPAAKLPTELYILPNGGFLLLDGKGKVVRIAPDGTAAPVFGDAEAGTELYLSSFSLQPDGIVVMTNEANHSLLRWAPDGPGGVATRSVMTLAGFTLARHWLVWGLAAAGALAILVMLVLLYVRVMRRRSPLLFKQLGVFLPVTILAVGFSSLWIFNDMMGLYTAGVEDRQLVWSQLGTELVSAEDIDALGIGVKSQGEIMSSEAFARLTDALTSIVHGNAERWNESTYDYIYVPAGKDWYVFDQFSYFERYLPKPAMLEVARSAQPAIVRYDDAYSSWLSAFSPILRPDGSVAALLEVTIDQNIFAEITANFQAGLAVMVGLILVALVSITFISTYMILLSIRSLKHSAALISQGNYDVQVDIKSRDEIEDLGEVFNQMSREIRSYVDRVVMLNQANAKFVPAQFLTFLGKESITEIRLGDQVQREMTVLFSDIRSFTTLSERMTPEENFNFINRYLMEMGPVIREAGGFIDKYIGDAIMALFPTRAEDGLKAALAMYTNLERLNRQEPAGDGGGHEAMHIGIGLHTGKLMLGIIGEAERFDGTVISDTVNLASRLESLTKYYGVGILVSGQLMEQLGNASFFESRLLDRVQVKGKGEAIEIHEVLVPSLPGYQDKRAARPAFAAALGSYFAGDFALAEDRFAELARLCPDDAAIPVYRRRMKSHSGQPGEWTGVTVLDSK
jgi:class 3 adenylate cyclase/HAMP domain-containing protein